MDCLFDSYNFGKVKVSNTTVEDAIVKITMAIKNNEKKYICVGNLRTTMLGQDDVEYRKVINKAYLNTPDGMPLVWVGKLAGKKIIQRTCGPDLFIECLKNKTFKHFFLGDTQETLDKLVEKVKDQYQANICGCFSPDFVKDYRDYNYEYIASLIKKSEANIVWVALGAPKQDFFDAELINYLDNGVLIGVGAAFRFVIGEYKNPPKVFKKMALTGLFWRVKYHPWQSFKWYVTNGIKLSYYSIVVLTKRFFK